MDKVILITGSSKGIGKYLADYYSSLEYTVIGCGRSKIESSSSVDYFEGDISDLQVVSELMTYIKLKYGKLDILINNAGIAAMNHSLLIPISTVSNIMNTNFISTFKICQESSRLMIPNNFGRIINLTSVAVPLNLEGEAAYAASKAAVESFTKILAKELCRFNITVNAVGPTPIKTDLIKNVSNDRIESLINMQSIKRIGEFGDVSNVIDFFIKPESGFITGQIIYLGGIS